MLLVRFGKDPSAAEAHLDAIDALSIRSEPARQARRALDEETFDCILLVGRRPTRAMLELVRKARQSEANAAAPLIVELATLPKGEQAEELDDAVVVPAGEDAAALLEALVQALHLPAPALPAEMQEAAAAQRQNEAVLAGHKIAVIDDDLRNIFSVTALLESQGIEVIQAENGQEGVELLKRNPDVSAALIDIMMPGMDGYETIRRIRKSSHLRDLPLIAVTAKAMPEDREKCFEVGASDYLSKPVDNDELLAVLRTWMKRRGAAEQRG